MCLCACMCVCMCVLCVRVLCGFSIACPSHVHMRLFIYIFGAMGDLGGGKKKEKEEMRRAFPGRICFQRN